MTLKAYVVEETIKKSGTKALDAIIGARLKEIRKREGMSQKEVAERLGISFQQFQRYEHGTNRVSAASLHQIANLFGLPMDSFTRPGEEPAKMIIVTDDEETRLIDEYRRADPSRRQQILKMLAAS